MGRLVPSWMSAGGKREPAAPRIPLGGTGVPAQYADGAPCPSIPEPQRRPLADLAEQAPEVPSGQRQKQGACHHHVVVVRQSLGEVAMEECGQGARAAARRARGETKQTPPQAKIGTAVQDLRGEQAERSYQQD